MNRFEIHEMGGMFLVSYAIELSRNGKNADLIYYKNKKERSLWLIEFFVKM